MLLKKLLILKEKQTKYNLIQYRRKYFIYGTGNTIFIERE